MAEDVFSPVDNRILCCSECPSGQGGMMLCRETILSLGVHRTYLFFMGAPNSFHHLVAASTIPLGPRFRPLLQTHGVHGMALLYHPLNPCHGAQLNARESRHSPGRSLPWVPWSTGTPQLPPGPPSCHLPGIVSFVHPPSTSSSESGSAQRWECGWDGSVVMRHGGTIPLGKPG